MNSPLKNERPFQEVRVVEASAGSGKTYTLSKRYVQLLLYASRQTAMPMRHILAITFTNKAAFEMKERILEFLKRMVLDGLTEEQWQDFLAPLDMGRERAKESAAVLMEQIIRWYNYFQVQTIDSFINALLSGCAYRIHLSARFKIRHNAAEYVEMALDQLIDDSARNADLRKMFESFLHQYLFIENRSGWFPKKDILGLMIALFYQKQTFGLPFLPYAADETDLFKIKKAILRDMHALAECLPAAINKTFQKSFTQFLEDHTMSFDIDRLSTFFAREEIPVRKDGGVCAEADRLWSKLHGEIRRLCELEALSIFNPYIEMYSLVEERMEALIRRDDVLFLEQLNHKARSLFGEDAITVEELYYRLATRYNQYLIDEFQDTSQLQWDNLKLMVEEALASGGGLFYVGDKKQAIYGFRGGDVRLFDRLKLTYQDFNVVTDSLKINRRSREAIVSFNNRIFSEENLDRFFRAVREAKEAKKDDITVTPEYMELIHTIFSGAFQECREDAAGGVVRLEHIQGANKAERLEITSHKIKALVKDLSRRYAFADIAILTRGNKDIELLTSWLLEEGVPVDSERTSNVKNNPVVQDLLAFLQFLDSPTDNAALARFMSGEVFAKASGVPSEKWRDTLFGLFRGAGRETFMLYKTIQDRYPDVWSALFDEFFRNVGLYPLYELVVSILDRFGCLSHFPDDQGFLMHWLELIKKHEEEEADLASFLKHFEALEGEELYVPMLGQNAVRLMTVHKSKGLQFPVVIIPFLGIAPNAVSRGKDRTQAFNLDFQDNGVSLRRLKQAYNCYSPALRDEYIRAYNESLLTEFNNVYVALTRPAEELYAFVPGKIANQTNLLPLFVPEECMSAGTPSAREPERAVISGGMILPPERYHNWIRYLEDEFAGIQPVRQRMAAITGEAVHALLAAVVDTQADRFKTKCERLWADVYMRFPDITDWVPLRHMVEVLCSHPQTQDVFMPREGVVFCEQEFIDENAQSHRVDRVHITATHVNVYDYKTAAEDPSHHAQIKGYMDLLGRIYPGRTVRGYVIYVDPVRMLEVAV